jgi:tetratricopeptide (TPR) repeat protein
MSKEENACTLLGRGLQLLEEGNPAQAALVLERARRAEPGKGSILEALGKAHFSTGRYDVAASCFEEALEVDPTNDYAHYCLGLCCLKLKRKGEAAGHFKLAWTLRPSTEYSRMARRFGAAEVETVEEEG